MARGGVAATFFAGLLARYLDVATADPRASIRWAHRPSGALAGQVEDGTPFGRWFAAGVAPLPSEGAAADQFRRASAVLRGAGYEHYEVSSYARPGKR